MERQVFERYLDAGFSPIPLTGKRPFINNWQKFSKEKPTLDDINSWNIRKDTNIGICLGPATGIIAIDIDCEDAGLMALIPDSPFEKKGKKGWTRLFFGKQRPMKLKPPGSKVPVFELLGEGNQTVVPPSIHPESGKPYVNLGKSLLEFKDHPELMPTLEDQVITNVRNYVANMGLPEGAAQKNLTEVIGEVRCRNGSWDYLKEIACRLINSNLDPVEATNRLIEADKEYNKDEPVPYFGDMSRGTSQCGADPFSNALKFYGGILYTVNRDRIEKKTKPQLPVQAKEQPGVENELRFRYSTGYFGRDGAVKNLKRNYDELLEEFDREYHHITIAETGSVWVYRGTHFKSYEKPRILNYAEKMFLPEPTNRERVEFFEKCKANNIRSIDTIGNKPGYINCENGVVNIKSGKLQEHSPKFGFLYTLPYDYDAKAECPTFRTLIKNITLDRDELSSVLQEFFGYCIYGGSYKYNKALILSGTGSNGKSTLINVMKNAFGEDNCSGVTLTEIHRNYGSARLEGKLANFSAEENTKCFSDAGPFKKLTGQDMISVRKIYEAPYEIENKAKIVISYNEVPHLPDKSRGMRRRLMIIPFDLNLDDNPEKKIDNVYEKCKEENAGILNWAIEGWKRLEERGGFSEGELIAKEKSNILITSDPILEWYQDSSDIMEWTGKDEDRIPVRVLRELYYDEVEPENNRKTTAVKFARRLKAILSEDKKLGKFEIRKAKIDGQAVRCVYGFKLVENESF